MADDAQTRARLLALETVFVAMVTTIGREFPREYAAMVEGIGNLLCTEAASKLFAGDARGYVWQLMRAPMAAQEARN